MVMVKKSNFNTLRSLILLFLISLSVGAYAQKMGELSTYCDVGFLYEISYQESWGDSYAVVAEVMPGGPAQRAGLKVGDVLLTVNGKSTRAINEEALTAMLLDPREEQVQVTIARLGMPEHQLKLRKECRPVRALSESLLASSFSMYSLEDVNSRRFVMPFTYSLPTKEDFLQYRTFSFEKSQLNGVEQEVAKELTKKGLRQVPTGGDLLVQVRHVVEQNPSFRPGAVEDVNRDLRNYRASAVTGGIEEFPFLSINSPSFSGSHQLVVEVELLKGSTRDKVWGVVAREKLNQSYSTQEYARAFMPLILANFPKMRYVMNPIFVLHQNTYRYTGIYYDADDLQLVAWVDEGSPAAKAGIQPGDRVVAINGLPLDKSVKKMTEAYKSFIAETWEYRNPETVHPSEGGLSNSMYWRVDKYLSVADAIQNPKYMAVFSYLFSHRTYVNSPIVKQLVFDVRRGDEEVALFVTPELKELDYLTQK